MKKIIALLLICCMVLPMVSAAAAATEEPTPTIEEILNEYHDKAFAAQTAEENGGASTYARGGSGSSKALEQETVDQLTQAGYEAYIVTADNYDTVAETLNTDLADMGLNPDSSYVVAVSGSAPNESPSTNSNPNSRVIQPPLHEDLGGDAGSTFTYTQGEITYTMRYVTITGTNSSSELWAESKFTLSEIDHLEIIMEYLCDVGIEIAKSYIIDSIAASSPVAATICSFAMLAAEEGETLNFNPYEALDPDTVILEAKTAWTRSYIQIYNGSTGLWHTAQCSSYAVTLLEIEADEEFFNPNTELFEEIGGVSKYTYTYSPYYNNSAVRKSRAVEGYGIGAKLHDCTGNLEFSIIIPQEIIGLTYYEQLIFTHNESTAYLLPLIQEE